MNIGKVLRERAKFPVYVLEPKKKPDNWGLYPNLRINESIFFEEDEFVYLVSFFSHDALEILKMQDAAITEAAKGLKKDGWEFWLHAANHKIKKSERLYSSEIRFVFKVKNAPQKIQEEGREDGKD